MQKVHSLSICKLVNQNHPVRRHSIHPSKSLKPNLILDAGIIEQTRPSNGACEVEKALESSVTATGRKRT